MGLAVAAAGNGPPPVDIGALFGLGARLPTNPEKSWKWEAPYSQQPTFGAGPPPPPPKATNTGTWHLFEPRTKKKPIVRAMDHEQLLRESIETSQAAFQHVLASFSDQPKIDRHAMEQITSFLHSSADEPKAQNLLHLFHWLGDRQTAAGALIVLAERVRDKAVLRTLDSEEQLVALLGLLLERGHHLKLDALLAETLNALPGAVRHGVTTQLSKLLRTRVVLQSTGKQQDSVGSVRLWLRTLDSTRSMQGHHARHPVWRAVYQDFAGILKPAQIAAHFEQMREEEFAEVLLNYWGPHYLADLEIEQAEAIDYGTTKLLNFRQQSSVGRPNKVEERLMILINDFATLRGRRQTDAAAKAYEQDYSLPFVDLLAVFAAHNTPHQRLLAEILDTLKAQSSAATGVWRFFKALKRSRKVGIPTTTAKSLMYYFMKRSDSLRPSETEDATEVATEQPKAAVQSQTKADDSESNGNEDLRRAWLVFKSVPSLSVLECIELPLKLVERGYGTPDRIFYMLNRKVGPEIVLPEFRDTPTMALQPAHVDLVHLVAHAWASQTRKTSRVTFRRVWETYRFLQDRGAPLSVLMSRALVKAGILRPIQEGKAVPIAQLKYIISLVQRLEGDDVASNLDRLVFHVNKKLKDPNNPAVIARQRGWAGRLDEGIVRVVKWRLKLWTKGKGKWYNADGPVKEGQLSLNQEEALQSSALREVAADSSEHEEWRQEVDDATKNYEDVAAETAAEDYFDVDAGGSDIDSIIAAQPVNKAEAPLMETMTAVPKILETSNLRKTRRQLVGKHSGGSGITGVGV